MAEQPARRGGGDGPVAPAGSLRVDAVRTEAARPVRVTVAAAPDHPANVVDVAYRIDGRAPRVARAAPAIAGSGATQDYVARRPALQGGQRLDYRAELRRAGRLLGTAPAGGGWRSLTALPDDAAAAAPAAPGSLFPASDATGAPRFDFDLEFLGGLTAELRAEVLGHTPQGWRINFFIVRGEVRGPRLHGLVRPEGGDWMCIRPDGVGEVNIRVTYETTDGALLLEESVGVFDLGPDGYADVVRGVYTGAPAFYSAPTYITADARWKWINSLQCFGFGRVVMKHLRVECDVYAPRLKGGPALD